MATHAFGATLTWNSQVVAKLDNVGGYGVTVASRRTTVHKTTDRFETFGPGLVTADDIVLSGYFDHTDSVGQVAMAADAVAGTIRTFAATLPASTGTAVAGSGFLTSYKVGDMDIEGNIPFTATIKPTGVITMTVATVTGASAIAISGAGTVIAPTFAAGTGDYVVDVANAVSTVTFTVTSGETITLGYDGVTQALTSTVASSAVALVAGVIKTFTVTISNTNKASKVYTFRVVRAV